jgi:hypothetical protein
MKITISTDNLKAEFEEQNTWEETKIECWGALHRILLARDRNKKVTGVNRFNG